MLQALVRGGTVVQAWRTIAGLDFACPSCGEAVILKRGPIVVEHFAHRPHSRCRWGTGESRRHMEMKRQVIELVTPEPTLEVVGLAEGRRADLFISPSVVIECQASAIGLREWAERSADYRSAGFDVIWIWDEKLIFGKRKDSDTYRLGASVLEDAELEGSIYVLSGQGVLFEVVARQVEARLWTNAQGQATRYVPGTIRCLRSSRLREPLIVNDNAIIEASEPGPRPGAIHAGPFVDRLFRKPTERFDSPLDPAPIPSDN